MNDDIIQDLKQFIAATVSQQTYELREDIQTTREDIQTVRGEIQRLDEKLTAKIDDLSSAVAEALESSNEANAVQLQDHEQRIARLEQGTA